MRVVTPSYAASSTNITLVVEWETFWGETEEDGPSLFPSLIQTVDGGFAVLVTTFDLSTDEEHLSLVKFTPNGQQEWNITLGKLPWGTLVQTADEGYVISSRTRTWDIWLFKMNTRGQLEWNRTFGGAEGDWANSMILTKDGGFALAGGTNYNGSSDSWWDYDMGLVKTNSLGVPEWNSTFVGSATECAQSVIQTIDGGYAVAGITDSNREWWEFDMWLVKTDADGIEEWNQTFGGPEEESMVSMIQLADGSFLLAGNTKSFTSGGNDFWLLKTDPNGHHVWNVTYGSNVDEEVRSLIQTVDGGYLLAGNADNFPSDYDIWLVKTDATGQQEWNATLGDVREDRVSSVIQLSDGSFVIAGSTQPAGFLISTDMWLLKVKVSEGTVTTDTSTTTTTTTPIANGGPGFEFSLAFLGLSLALIMTRKRKP